MSNVRGKRGLGAVTDCGGRQTKRLGGGLALGFIAYPLVKLLAGQGREVKWLMYIMAVVLIVYFVTVRVQTL